MEEQNQQQTLPPEQPTVPPQNLNPVPAATNPNSPQQSLYEKRNWLKWGLIYLSIAVLIYGGIYYLAAQQKKSSPYSTTFPMPTIIPSPTPDATTNWKTYKNTTYGFSLKYPPTWQLQDHSELHHLPNYISFYPPQVNLALDDPGVPSIDANVNSRPLSSYPTGNLTQEGIPMITDWKTVSVNGINGIYYQVHQCAP